ncbi:hypothetical protein KY346_05735 [Candidatus Woesearchaeota archaeon]|nr:hypothetical protein [Candidatus Woesearchaeota archaeon]
MTVDSVLGNQAYAQAKKEETKTLQEVLSAEIKRLKDKKDKTVEEQIRFIEMHDYSMQFVKDKTKEDILKVIQEIKQKADPTNPAFNYILALEANFKGNSSKAKELFQKVVSNESVDKRIRSNAKLGRLKHSRPVDLSEKDYLSVLDIDPTNLLAYAGLLGLKDFKIGTFRKDNARLTVIKRNKELDDLIKEYKKICDTTIQKADIIKNPVDRLIFKCAAYKNFIDMFIEEKNINFDAYSQISPTSSDMRFASKNEVKSALRLRLKFAELVDSYLQKWIEIDPSYDNFIIKAENAKEMIRGVGGGKKAVKKYDVAIEALTNALKIRKTCDAYCSLARFLRDKAINTNQKSWERGKLGRTQKKILANAIDAYETALTCKFVPENVKSSLPSYIAELKSKLK